MNAARIMNELPVPINEMMDSMVNIQQLCRLCGSKTEENDRLNIFDSSVVTSFNLQFKIETLLGIKISIEDCLPKVTCCTCFYNLDNFSKFKATCETTDRILSRLCNQEIALGPEQGTTPPITETSDITVQPENVFIKSDFPEINNQVFNNNTGALILSNPNVNRKRKQLFTKSNKVRIECKKTQQRNVLESGVNKKRKSRKSSVPFNCDLCSKSYYWKCALSKHILLNHLPSDGKLIKCKICNKIFKTKDSRRVHIKNIHKKTLNYVCDSCGKGFMYKQLFIYHVRRQHTNERPYECLKCDKKFVSKYILKSHMTNVHKDDTVQWICNICNKSYSSKNTLNSHKRIHTISLEDRRKMQCTICNSRFEQKCDLTKHMRRHTGERPYKCKICGNGYSSSGSLKIHTLTHTGERNHVCEVCGSAFALAKNLEIHKRSVHEGLKMYKCNDCDKSYTQNKNLNIHLRSTGHTKLKK